MSSIRRSLFISLTERYFIIVLKLVSFVVLARLLTPSDIGIFSVSAAFIGIAHVVRDFGVGSYLIQEENLTINRKRTAFTITLIIGLSFFLIIQLLSTPIAAFYNDSRMQNVLNILAFNFLLIPFNSVTLATLRRDMKFNVLFWINIAAATVGTTTALTLATLNFGYMSLVWASIANTSMTCLGGLAYRRTEFWMRPTLSEWRRIFSFGSRATAASVITEIAMNANDLIVGRVLGFAPVAILNRAQGVMYLFHRDVMSAIRNVAYPGFSKAFREGADLEVIHSRTVTALTAIAWPFYGFLAIFPLEILRILFGPQWDAAAPLVPIFCLAGAIAVLWNLNLPLITAMGRIDLTLRAELIIQVFRILAILFVAIYFDSLMPFAVALLVTYALQLIVFYYIKGIVLPTNFSPRIEGLKASIKLTLATLTVPLFIKLLIILDLWKINGYLAVSLAAITSGIAWVLHLRASDHPLKKDEILPDKLRRLITK